MQIQSEASSLYLLYVLYLSHSQAKPKPLQVVAKSTCLFAGHETLTVGRLLIIILQKFCKKNNKIVINGVDQAEIDDIINFICTT